MTEPDSIMHPIRNDLITVSGDYLTALVHAYRMLRLRVDVALATNEEIASVKAVQKFELNP